jgi:hypothetical protein
MNKLYVIGGLPRCGKTTILNDVIQIQPMIGVSSDAIRAGVRYLNEHNRINEEHDVIEDVIPWEILIGLIQRYDHKNIPLIVEGIVFTPERVNSLRLKNLVLRAAFVGFSSDDFVEQAIEYGKQSKDWVYEKINANNGSEEDVREMFAGLQQKGAKLKEEAREYGYQYFTPDNKSFADYKIEVANFLLEKF